MKKKKGLFNRQNIDKNKKTYSFWAYGYYACSSLCMTTTIDHSQNHKENNHFNAQEEQ